MKNILPILIGFLFIQCQYSDNQRVEQSSVSIKPEIENAENPPNIINENGKTIETRFNLPEEFDRVEVTENSFEKYLRTLPLKSHGTKVLHFDGSTKWNQSAAAAVVDIDVGKRDLQQCADAVMRLRAEYLWKEKRFEEIHFNYTNGFNAEYKKWREGYRIKVSGNKVSWQKTAEKSDSYEIFRKYLTQVFIYAGTLSLDKELKSVNQDDLKIGDVFIQGGSPGHAVIVVDVAKNFKTNETIFLLAQSYMPAQSVHVLTNPNNENGNPWYNLDFENQLETAEWNFYKNDLKRF